MRSRSVTRLALSIVLAALTGCAGAPATRGGVVGMDELVRNVAAAVVDALGQGQQRAVAVSYFTMEGETSGLSDYLIGELTTSLANQGKGKIKVLGRQLMDRTLAEASFQLSDLAETDGQVRLGKQLGADLILAGFVTPLEGRYRLNAQLVEVETGVVVAGLVREFVVEGELGRKIEPRGSQTVLVRRERPEVAGVSTVTTLFEDFDHGPPEIQLQAREEHYGERVRSASGRVEVAAKASQDGSACARFLFEAALDSDDVVSSWADSGLQFLARIATGQGSRGFDGLSLSVKAEGFSMGTLYLKQQGPDGEIWFHLDLAFAEGEWQEHKIPFASFMPGEPGYTLDPAKPIVVEFAIPFLSNWLSYSLRGGTDIQAALSVDSVGFYKAKSRDDARVVDTFDDEIERLPLYAYLYNTSLYTDYTENDQGEQKLNPGVKGQTIRLGRKEGGAAGGGRYWSMEARLDLTGRIRELHEDQQSVGLFARAPLVANPRGFTALSFYVRSDLLTSCGLELQDPEHERSYYYEFAVSSFWTRVRVPFGAWAGEQGSVQDALNANEWPRRTVLFLAFQLPERRLEQVGAGELRFELALDDFLFEK